MKQPAVVFIGAVIALAASAQATLMTPGATFSSFPPIIPPIFAEPDPTGGVLVAGGTMLTPFFAATYSGTVTCNVYANDPSNPWAGAGGLTFVYEVHNDGTSPQAIDRFTVDGYVSALVDMSFRPGAGVAPFRINRQANADTLGWSFDDYLTTAEYRLIHPGDTTVWLVAQTDATAFRTVVCNVIDGSVTSMTTLGPAVPTPGSAALLGAGLLATARRRRS